MLVFVFGEVVGLEIVRATLMPSQASQVYYASFVPMASNDAI